MKIMFDEDDVIVVADALAKCRGLQIEFGIPFAFAPGSVQDKIYTDARRVVAAFRNRYGN